MMNDVKKRLGEQGMNMEVAESVYTFLAKTGFDEAYGARPLRRAILRHLEDPLSEALLRHEFNPGDTIYASVEGEEVVFGKKPQKAEEKAEASSVKNKKDNSNSGEETNKKETNKENTKKEEDN